MSGDKLTEKHGDTVLISMGSIPWIRVHTLIIQSKLPETRVLLSFEKSRLVTYELLLFGKSRNGLRPGSSFKTFILPSKEPTAIIGALFACLIIDIFE